MSFEVRQTKRDPLGPWIALLMVSGAWLVALKLLFNANTGDLASAVLVGAFAIYRLVTILLWPGVGERIALLDDRGITIHRRRLAVPWQWHPAPTREWTAMRQGAVLQDWRGRVNEIELVGVSSGFWAAMVSGKGTIPIKRGDRTLTEVISAIDGRLLVQDHDFQAPHQPPRVPIKSPDSA